jgi:pyridoxamine 5'-phosphate oxidase
MLRESNHLAPWRSPLARNLYKHRSQPQSRYLQLATIDLDGRPTNRTVVFRGFVDHLIDHSNLIKFVSDRRSSKNQHLQNQPWAEVCWYFPDTREQFRIAGKILVIDIEQIDPIWQKLRKTAWHDLSTNARAQFGWLDPGSPIIPPKTCPENSSEKLFEPIHGSIRDTTQTIGSDYAGLPENSPDRSASDSADDITNDFTNDSSDNFSLLLLEPYIVDRLELRTNPFTNSQSRTCYQKKLTENSEIWTTQSLNP